MVTSVALAPDDLCLGPKNKIFAILRTDVHSIAISFDDLATAFVVIVVVVVVAATIVDLQVGGNR